MRSLSPSTTLALTFTRSPGAIFLDVVVLGRSDEPVLRAGAQDLGDPGKDRHFGHGLIQADSSLEAVRARMIATAEKGSPDEVRALVASLGRPAPFFATEAERVTQALVDRMAHLDDDVSRWLAQILPPEGKGFLNGLRRKAIYAAREDPALYTRVADAVSGR